MSWLRSKISGDEEIKKLNEDKGAQCGNVLCFARHRVNRMSEVNDRSLHANIGTVMLHRETCNQDIDTHILTGE